MDEPIDDTSNAEHLLLLIGYFDGIAKQEPVHVAGLDGGQYRLLYSPGFVGGVAAGDIVRLLNKDGAFEVVSRSGNLAIQVYSRQPISKEARIALVDKMFRCGARLDGAIENGLVFTVTKNHCLEHVLHALEEFVINTPNSAWWYGNNED